VSFRVNPRGTLLLLFLLAATAARPQSEGRNRMDVPPTTIFKGMLRFAAERDPEKIQRSLALLQPILVEHRAAFGAASVDALAQRVSGDDVKASEQAILTLIARDVVLLLRAVSAAPPARARTVLLAAALEWQIVADSLTHAGSADSAAARKLSERFEELLGVISAKNEKDGASVATLSARLERDVAAFFR
jgi:hypothetical protein